MEANKTTISISSKGLRNLECLPIDRDFEFIVGKDHYPTFKLVACILSPIIGDLLQKDPNMKSYNVEINDKNHNFQLIMDIVYDHDYSINIDNCFFLYRIAEIFGNEELKKIANIEYHAVISESNCLNLLLKMIEVDFDTKVCASFAASHFEALSKNPDLKKMPIEIYNQIFFNDEFHFTKRTYQIMKDILADKPDFLAVFKKICFHYFQDLTPANIQDFIEYIEDDDFPEAGEVIKEAVMKARPK
ncbi:hypothetical protein TRFO_03512 [Tritrichomonas foetus]|uniref:BTB domain-containing protein n=1 Tax=Tritrichomonas foetus TaxID=1144522 RepID=A0A1J4KTU0_9EUKA|nr:hypothetical protein TRFO_03512 [Tritrichomonas foetus]|eukprot:OHT13078.1 hypothetical protein TRFO_03512 [Tritrichomonas foetus]